MGGDRRALKILHIDPERAWGGGEAQVIGLLTYLSRRGHRNHLLCHPDGSLDQEARRIGIATSPIKIRNDLDLRAFFVLRRLIRTEGCDVVHFHTKRAHALSLGLGPGYAGAKYVVTRRMDYPVRGNWYHRYLYNRQVDGIVAISKKIAEIMAAGGVRREKIRIIYSGVDPALYAEARMRVSGSDAPVIGTVAVLEERKGHRYLLEAAALLKRQGHRLTYHFAGEGSRKDELQGLVQRLGLQEEVHFLGFVSDVPRFLASIDLLVLPSLYEGLGVSVLEAMAAGKAVVASRVGGLPELVEDSVTGLLIPPKDPPALAAAIAGLVSQRNRIKEMGENARERVEQNFTMERMAKQNEEYYYELLQGRGD